MQQTSLKPSQRPRQDLSTLKEFLSYTDNKKSCADPTQWTVSCPAPTHNGDSTPSLSVLAGDLKPIVLDCKAGCEYEDVRAAYIDKGMPPELLDRYATTGEESGGKPSSGGTVLPRRRRGASPIPLEDQERPEFWNFPLMYEREVPTSSRAVEALTFLIEERGLSDETLYRHKIGWDGQRITIPVADETGVWVNVRYYRPQPPDGAPKMLNERGHGSGSPLYPVSVLADNELPVLFCEGEWDALLARQVLNGRVVAVSGTGGAGTVPRDLTPLSNRDVFIAYDCDDAGQRGAEKLAEALTGIARSVSILDLTDCGLLEGSGQDVTDLLLRDAEAADALLASLDRAELISSPIRLTKVRASDVEVARVQYAWEGRMPLRGMTLIAGEEGIGKSLVEIDLIAQATRGLLAGELHGKPQTVYLLLPEDDTEAVVAPRLRAANADMDRIVIVTAPLTDGSGESQGRLNLPADLPLLAQNMHADGARLVFCDSFADLLSEGLDAHVYKSVVQAIHKIIDWATENNFAVAGLWHINKVVSSDSAIKLMGSRGFRTAIRSVLMVARDPDASEGQNAGIVVLDKVNAGKSVPGLRYAIESWSYTVEEVDEVTGETRTVDADCGRISWTGETDGDGRGLLRESFGVEHTGRGTEATAWLRDFLERQGPTPRAEVLKEAKADAGLSESTVKRAAGALRLRSHNVPLERPGKPPLPNAVWALPDDGGPLGRDGTHTRPNDPKDPKAHQESSTLRGERAGQPPLGPSGPSGRGGSADPQGDPKAGAAFSEALETPTETGDV